MPPAKDQQLPPYFEKFLNERFDAILSELAELKKDRELDKKRKETDEKRLSDVEGVVKILKWAFGSTFLIVIALSIKALENWLF